MEQKFDGDKVDCQFKDEFMQTGNLHFKTPKAIEFERYKQDCRKRSLDLASSHINRDAIGNSLKINPSEVLNISETYYNWLISIPNS